MESPEGAQEEGDVVGDGTLEVGEGNVECLEVGSWCLCETAQSPHGEWVLSEVEVDEGEAHVEALEDVLMVGSDAAPRQSEREEVSGVVPLWEDVQEVGGQGDVMDRGAGLTDEAQPRVVVEKGKGEGSCLATVFVSLEAACRAQSERVERGEEALVLKMNHSSC